MNNQSKYLVNKDLLKYSKKNQIIINTSRGEIIKESDLILFLKKGKISGYGTDVLENEFDNIKKSVIVKNLKKLNIIITPHIGGMTVQGQLRAWRFAIKKI